MDAKHWWTTRPTLRPERWGSRATTPDVASFLRSLPLALKGTEPAVREQDWEWWSWSKADYLTAFATARMPAPGILLDVGCGEGFVTCFYARLYPQAEVLAIDVDAESVAATRKLAVALRLQNVRVVECDVRDIEANLGELRFDVIVSRTAAFRSKIRTPGHWSWPGQSPDVVCDAEATQMLKAIHHALVPGSGHFVSTEGWNSAHELWSWATLLASVGFGIDWLASRVARLGCPRERALWPMLIARPQSGPTCTPIILEEVVAFLAGSELEAETRPATLYGHAAEALFDALTSRRLFFGFQITCPDRSAWRRELWQVGALLASYDYTNRNERQLTFWPLLSVAEIVSQLEREAEDFRANGWDVISYTDPATRLGGPS